MKVLIVEPLRVPRVAEIDGSLKSMQEIVGGYIEAVYPYEDLVALVCNEEGKNEGLPLNRELTDEDGNIYDIIAGTFFITGLREDNFESLSDDLIKKYSKVFATPVFFIGGYYGD